MNTLIVAGGTKREVVCVCEISHTWNSRCLPQTQEFIYSTIPTLRHKAVSLVKGTQKHPRPLPFQSSKASTEVTAGLHRPGLQRGPQGPFSGLQPNEGHKYEVGRLKYSQVLTGGGLASSTSPSSLTRQGSWPIVG
jgi:hypothetical protein